MRCFTSSRMLSLVPIRTTAGVYSANEPSTKPPLLSSPNTRVMISSTPALDGAQTSMRGLGCMRWNEAVAEVEAEADKSAMRSSSVIG